VPARRVLALALSLSLTGVLVWRSVETLGFRARFQRAEAERARSAIEDLIDRPAMVLTRSDIGRPAENINYYTGATAVYEQELQRWGVDPITFVSTAVRRGFATYLLMPPREVDRWRAHPRFRRWFKPELVARIPRERAAEYFVASPTHGGVSLELFRVRLKPELEGRAGPS
jgi:hypothetical protein